MANPKFFCAALVAASLVLFPASGFAQKKDCDEKGGNSSMSEGTYRALERIHEMIAEDNYKEAEERLTRMLDRGSDYEKAVTNQTLGFVYIQQSDYKRGLAAFEKALALGSLPQLQAEQLKYNAGQLYIADGNYPKGIKTLEEYMAQACGEIPPEAHIQLAAGYAEQKQFRKALVQVDKALAKSKEPKEQWLQLKLALHYELKEFPNCAEVLVSLIALVPDKPEYWKQLNGIFFEIKKDPEALAVLALANRKGHLVKESEYRNLASIYMLLDVPYEAAETMEAGISAGKVEATQKNLEFIGDAWLTAREMNKSAAALKRAAQAENSGDVWKRLAQVLTELEDWSGAIEAADEAIRAKTEDPGTAHMIKGVASFNANRPKAAIAAFRDASRFSGTRSQAQQWIAYVESELVAVAQAQAAEEALKTGTN